ncbi:MAG: DUF1292 domain-containing protein [Lachnospiraceae bacterium]|nr:DUF1292 domain-containing protein [Lachnospiraceae bacterium]
MGTFDDELDNIICLTDENGRDVSFELLDLIVHDGREFVILLPHNPENDELDEVLILEVEDDDSTDHETYVGVEDENLLNEVFGKFKEKNKDNYEFV